MLCASIVGAFSGHVKTQQVTRFAGVLVKKRVGAVERCEAEAGRVGLKKGSDPGAQWVAASVGGTGHGKASDLAREQLTPAPESQPVAAERRNFARPL